MTWIEVLQKYNRIAVTGGPLTGKTTLALSVPLDRPLVHTDSFMKQSWKAQPLACLAAVLDLPRFVIEGVQVPRALRKGMKIDVVVWLSIPKQFRTKNQDSFAKAVETVYLEWKETHSDVKEVNL